MIFRRLILSAAFLSLAGIVSEPAYGQHSSPSNHPVWGKQLTPEEIKAALSRLNGGDLEFEQMLLERIAKEHPEIDPQLLKSLLGDKAFRERANELAQKWKDQGKKLPPTPDEVGKMLKQLPDLPQQPAKKTPMPQADPGIVLPKDPPIPKFPEIKLPQNNPKDRGPQAPLPGNQQPPAPPGMGGPGQPPNPFGAPPANAPPMLPPTNPFGPVDGSADARTKSMEAMAALWEKNVGPLDETPEVKRAIFDLVSGQDGALDFLDAKDQAGVWDWLNNNLTDTGGGDGLNLGGGKGPDGDWNLPKLEMPELGWSKWFDSPSRPNIPSAPRSSGGGGGSGGGLLSGFGGIGGGSASWLPLVLLGALVVGAAVLSWWIWRDRNPMATGGSGGLGPWPVDPRSINSREDVVKAFEYLSVLLCGPGARVWTHSTVAEALSGLAEADEEAARKLARLYELARYAPVDEPLGRSQVIEARHIVCDLAGVL